jgi:hypothetical protein
MPAWHAEHCEALRRSKELCVVHPVMFACIRFTCRLQSLITLSKRSSRSQRCSDSFSSSWAERESGPFAWSKLAWPGQLIQLIPLATQLMHSACSSRYALGTPRTSRFPSFPAFQEAWAGVLSTSRRFISLMRLFPGAAGYQRGTTTNRWQPPHLRQQPEPVLRQQSRPGRQRILNAWQASYR